MQWKKQKIITTQGTEFAQGIYEVNQNWGLELGACSEKIDKEKTMDV